jgi:signal transduction histidine kinase/ligand-binding sensor domain-containing protein
VYVHPFRNFPRLFATALLFAVGVATRATSGNAEPEGFVERSWMLEEGLPHNVVKSIVQDKKGFVWVGTVGGLARFDGLQFKEYPLDSAGDNVQSIRDLAVAPDGSLIVLPASGGIRVLRDDVVRIHPATSALAGQLLFNVFFEPDGAMWIVSSALHRWRDGQLQTFGPEEGFHRKYGARVSFAMDQTGELWVGMADKVYRLKNDRFVSVPGTFAEPVTLATARDGGLWIATADRLMRRRAARLETVYAGAHWGSLGEIAYLLSDDDNALWIATRSRGLFRHGNSGLKPIPVPNQRTLTMRQDSEGNLWLGTNGSGLSRLRPKTYTRFDTASGLKTDVSTSVTEDAEGAVWIANRDGGLVRWKNRQLEQVLPLPGSKTVFPVGLVCPDRAGNLWFSAADGLYRLPVAEPQKLAKVADIEGPIYGLFCARNGDVWVSAENHFWGYFREGVYHAIPPADSPPLRRISAVTEGSDGSLLFALNEGEIYAFRDGRFTRHALPLSPQMRIHVLHADSRGALWIGTQHGLLRQRGDELHTFTVREGLPDDLITQILEDDEARLWIGSRRGIFRVSLAALDDVAAGRTQRVAASVLGRDEGLAGSSSFVGGPPTAWKGREGTLWFVTHRGVIGLDPTLAKTPKNPPPVYIDSIRADGVAHVAPASGALSIPPERSQLEFRFAALNYAAPERVRLRHQLVGLDRDWVETGPERAATYARVPPGNYRLRVIAGNQDGVWNQEGATLAFTVQPAWWQTGWLRAAVFIAFTALIVFTVRVWSHRRLHRRLERLEREHALELERARIARDLHDELGGSLTQIGFLAERVRRQSNLPEIEKPLADLASRTRHLATELEGIIWATNPKNHTWRGLAQFLGEYAQRFFRDTAIVCFVETDDDLPDTPVSPEAQHHLLAIAKESINNIFKHARALHVQLTLRLDEQVFVLHLRDDGIGFDPDSPTHSERNGLTNMRSRALEIGATLRITSEPGAGSELILRVPLDATLSRPSEKAPRAWSTSL